MVTCNDSAVRCQSRQARSNDMGPLAGQRKTKKMRRDIVFSLFKICNLFHVNRSRGVSVSADWAFGTRLGHDCKDHLAYTVLHKSAVKNVYSCEQAPWRGQDREWTGHFKETSGRSAQPGYSYLDAHPCARGRPLVTQMDDNNCDEVAFGALVSGATAWASLAGDSISFHLVSRRRCCRVDALLRFLGYVVVSVILTTRVMKGRAVTVYRSTFEALRIEICNATTLCSRQEK